MRIFKIIEDKFELLEGNYNKLLENEERGLSKIDKDTKIKYISYYEILSILLKENSNIKKIDLEELNEEIEKSIYYIELSMGKDNDWFYKWLLCW